jgi:hypothetical protein
MTMTFRKHMDFNEANRAVNFRQELKIKQTRFWVSVAFYLPDEIAATRSAIDTIKVRGQYLIGFNFQPRKNEVFPYEGYFWKVEHDPIQFPSRYNAKSKKYPPYLMATYLDSYDDQVEMMVKLIALSINS